jgi:hypothetical protein
LEHDRHIYGLFKRAEWLRLMRDVGFELKTISKVVDDFGRDLFVGRRAP